MKTVKRKADVGERVLVTSPMDAGKRYDRGNVLEVTNLESDLSVTARTSGGTYATLYHHEYEVIIEDEPKVTVDENGVTVEYSDGRRDEYTSQHAKFYEPGEREPKTIKFGYGPVVKDEGSNAYIDAVDVKDGIELLTSLFADEVEIGAIPPHSSHYHQHGLDPLEVMRRTFPPEQYEGFLRGSLLKYTMRYDRKGQQQEDLEKLNFYGRELEEWKNALKDVDGKVIEAEGAE